MTTRRAALGTIAATGALALPRIAHAAWPADRPIEVVVPYPPGGGVDTMARMVLPAVQNRLPGARFIVTNRAGAGGQLGWEVVYNAPADGFMLAATSVPAMVTYPMERTTRYKAMDFTFIANVVDDPGGLFVSPNSPLRTLEDLVAAAKARPGAISYGTTGIGSDDHLLVLGLEDKLSLPPMTHVPFNGMAPLSTALVGGHLQVGAFNMSEGLALLRDNRIRCLGQAAAARWSGTPEVPTFKEQGVDLISGATRGIVGPPNMPAEITARLETAFRQALADTDFVREAERMGLPLAPRIGADFRNDIAALEVELRGLWQRRPWKES
ncbi:tripartite tricarboxylate transporter substrate binding protein [Roseomonas terrae]|uniref:Tripartite tricarboxylate transporter substrate binding protein n=1 Tax=Neoroseomonas terrae TaxID=424799 RepID=A0ABS5EJJ4_9PROT|nr:tripartite tricarboxylate transporter substrate binding protein [Neoroseomonas terrae]MBR0651197.1 tripartite tricarboxylate transporter substrate binding protein [Neoroseomonas terrae]